MKYTDPDGREDDVTNSNIVVIVVRDPASYETIGGKNPELKGKDFLVFYNKDSGESLWVPISSVPTMTGTTKDDAIAPGDIVLMLGPEKGSKYSPNVLTVAGGTLFSGDTLLRDGTTATNKVPWRVHDTMKFGSEGCLVGQTGNPSGSVVNVVATLKSWGLKYGDTFRGTLRESIDLTRRGQ